MQSLTHLDRIVFLSQLVRLGVEHYAGESLTLRILRYSDSQVIFENTYYPDEDGTILVYDINKVFEPYIDYDALGGNFFKVECNGASIVDSQNNPQRKMLVIPMSRMIEPSALDFISEYFLSLHKTVHRTSVGFKELLSLYCEESQDWEIYVEYVLNNLPKEKYCTVASIQGMVTLDVSHDRVKHLCVLPDEAKIHHYVIRCGRRREHYYVDKYPLAADPVVLYRNCFGVYELMHFTGVKSQETKYTRQTAILDCQYLSYDVEEERSYTASTRKKNLWDQQWVINDMATSEKVFLVKDGYQTGEQILITEVKDTTNNTLTDMGEFQITYRRASLYGDAPKMPVRPRIFDLTFDQTFE